MTWRNSPGGKAHAEGGTCLRAAIAAGVLSAALSTSAEVWYDADGVVVSGVGEASVVYRSESETNAWLDITVAAEGEATLTALTNNASASLSIAKLGSGKLVLSSSLALSFLVEEGTLQVPGDCWGGHNLNASGHTLVVHESGTVTAFSHVPLPNVVMRGGQFVNYTEIPAGEQDLRIYKCWAMKHLIKVLPSTNGSPSVIRGYASHIGHASYMPTFDIDAGAELQLDTMICNGEVGGGVSKDSGFTKIGPGTLTFLRGGSITGTSTLKEGTLKFAAGASLGPNATLNTWAGTTIELEDGAAFDTPVNSSLSCSAAEYAILTNCAIWVDAWQETAAEGASLPTIANRGTVGGVFAPPTSGACQNPCTFTANGVNGRPSYRFNGSNQSMWFKDLAYGTASAPQKELMIFVAFERSSYVVDGYRGFLSFALSTNTGNDNSSLYTLYHQDNSETGFGFRCGTSLKNDVSPCYATNGVPSVLSFCCESSSRRTRVDYLDGNYNSNSNSGAFELAFDRMSLGARTNPYAIPRNPWNGAIGEVVVCTNYNSAVRDTILDYMKRKWHSGTKDKKCGVAVIKVPQGTAAAATLGGLSDGRTPYLTKTGAGELMVGSVPVDGDVVVSEGTFSLIPTSVVAKIDVWMDAADEDSLTVANGEVVSVRNKGRASGSFVRNTRAGVSGTVSPKLPTLSTMNGHKALDFDGTRALVLDSYTNHNDDATYTVFVAARVGDGVAFTDDTKGKDSSPFSLSSIDSSNFDYEVPVGCYIEPKNTGGISFYGDVQGRTFGVTRPASMTAGNAFIFAYYNHSYGAYAYLQTFTNGVAADVVRAKPSLGIRPYPAAIDVVSVGGRLGPKGTSYYYGSASTGRLWNGQVGELIVCTRQPTADERAAILDYLRAKWCMPGDAPATPAAIETTLAPSLDRNVELAVNGGAELKSLAATQPLSGLSVSGDATLTRGWGTEASLSAMFDVAGDVVLPANMTLRVGPEVGGNASADLIRYSGGLVGPGTEWGVDARHPVRWSVEEEPGVIRIRYTPSGGRMIIR